MSVKSPVPFTPIAHSYETGLISSFLVTCGYCIGQGSILVHVFIIIFLDDH